MMRKNETKRFCTQKNTFGSFSLFFGFGNFQKRKFYNFLLALVLFLPHFAFATNESNIIVGNTESINDQVGFYVSKDAKITNPQLITISEKPLKKQVSNKNSISFYIAKDAVVSGIEHISIQTNDLVVMPTIAKAISSIKYKVNITLNKESFKNSEKNYSKQLAFNNPHGNNRFLTSEYGNVFATLTITFLFKALFIQFLVLISFLFIFSCLFLGHQIYHYKNYILNSFSVRPPPFID